MRSSTAKFQTVEFKSEFAKRLRKPYVPLHYGTAQTQDFR